LNLSLDRSTFSLSSTTARKIFWIAWPLLILVGLLLIGVQAVNLLGYEGQFVNHLRPSPAVALVNGVQLGQTFVAPRAGLERVDVLVHGNLWGNSQPATFHLRRLGDGRDIFSETFESNGARSWRWKSFQFAPLADSAGQAYYFFLESPAPAPDKALKVGGVQGDLYPEGTALINGHPAFADVAFKTFYANVSLAEKLSALAGKIVANKPAVWGDIRFYGLLALAYVLLVGRLGWYLYRVKECEP
jgi:hypothetical protein